MKVLMATLSFLPFGAGSFLASNLNTGGNIVKAQSGLSVTQGIRGRDTVPALLQQGESVIRTDTNQDLDNFLAAWKRSSVIGGGQLFGGGGGVINQTFEIRRPIDLRDHEDLQEDAAEAVARRAEAFL